MPGCRPGGRLTFLGGQKGKRKSRPCCPRPLRFASGQPAVLAPGLHRETLFAPAALRSNRRGESVYEAVAFCDATAQPTPCAPRRGKKGFGNAEQPASMVLKSHLIFMRVISFWRTLVAHLMLYSLKQRLRESSAMSAIGNCCL